MDAQPSPWTAATIVPGALLVAVACSQLYLTQFGELTPSKGGGFGMFAVTDARNSRTWSIEGVTEDGERCRIVVGGGEGSLGEWLSQRLRTSPDAATRAKTADRIFAMRYRPADYGPLIRSMRKAAALLPPGWQDLPLYRTVFAEDTIQTGPPVKMRAIRMQAWRVLFDPDTKRLVNEPIGAPEVRGQW